MVSKCLTTNTWRKSRGLVMIEWMKVTGRRARGMKVTGRRARGMMVTIRKVEMIMTVTRT